ncbi:Uncharacterized protein dnm_033200 [Desulfonema magnum]|uniref:Uncharacterized protein n=1 Tax=Desulfonema magnum TaxID=45655 RepID=A0A975BKV8_9BACT|nr:Uncharacterized protein dnm_033200 [Desulfonema magnum]
MRKLSVTLYIATPEQVLIGLRPFRSYVLLMVLTEKYF